jgi:hypothetical protein
MATKFFAVTPERYRMTRKRTAWVKGNIKMDLRKIILEAVDFIHLDDYTSQWRAFVTTVLNLHIPYKTMAERAISYPEGCSPRSRFNNEVLKLVKRLNPTYCLVPDTRVI